MKLSLKPNAEIMQIESIIAKQYGVNDFEEIDRGQVTSRSNGDIIKTLIELEQKKITDSV